MRLTSITDIPDISVRLENGDTLEEDLMAPSTAGIAATKKSRPRMDPNLHSELCSFNASDYRVKRQ